MAFLMTRFSVFSAAPVLFLILFPASFSLAQTETTPGERIVVCVIRLEHADAEELAEVLQPLLSPAGRIVPFRPTNTLILRDRASVVNVLSEAIKGSPCKPISEQPSADTGLEQKEYQLDR
jgi:type II secretory pathway component GspD/PulD (secretin)